MSLIDIYRKNLAQLPPHVQGKISEIEFHDTFERLLDCLSSDDLVEHDEAEQLHALINWTLTVLSSAVEPLDGQTLYELHDHYGHLADNASSRNWQGCQDRVRPILQVLSIIPTIVAKNTLESAQALRTELGKATRTLAESEASTSTKRREVEASVNQAAEEVIRALSELQHAAAGEMGGLLEDLRERYGFTAGQVLGGAHEIAAENEDKLAKSHGERSRRSMVIAVIWAAVAQVWWLTPLAPDWERWFDAFRSLPVVGSPIVILLFVAKREGRVAAEHRRRHARLQSLALQFKSWEPYRSTLKELPDDAKLQLEKQIAEKLFAGDSPDDDQVSS